MNLFFHPDGTAACLHSEAIPLQSLGTLTVRRASWIDFNQSRQSWEVRLDPKDNHPVFSSPNRDTCLQWEEKFFDLAGASVP